MSPITIRHGENTTTATKAELVTVSIERRSSGMPTRILVSGEPRIYWTPAGRKANPKLPREVLWVALGLETDEKLLLEAKDNQARFFEWDAFAIDGEHRTVPTGPVTKIPKSADRQSWSYSIQLESPALSRPLLLDPTIIVEPDP